MRVAVVGAGVVGLFAAHYLEKRGARITVIDRGPAGGACSAGNAGWICPSISFPLPAPGLKVASLRSLLRSGSPLYIKPSAIPYLALWLLDFRRFCNRRSFERGAAALARLAADAIPLFEALGQEGVRFEHGRDGLLMVFREPGALAEELELLHLTGYQDKVRRLSAHELVAAEPALLATDLAGGILAQPEWHVRPESLCSGLAESLRQRGVEIREHVEVAAIRCGGQNAAGLETSEGDLETDSVVITTGAEAARLSAQAGCPLPIQAGKGYSLTIERPRVDVRVPLYFPETKLTVTPFRGAVRVAGTMELSGINLEMDSRRIAALERAAEREVPGVLGGDQRRTWVGMRPITPDGLPCIGRLPARENVYIASGHQMLGMTLAPATGRALAELLITGVSSTDLEPFAPARFN